MKTDATSRPTGLRWAAEVALLAALLVVLARLSMIYASVELAVSPIWLPAGLSLAALTLRGKRLWPGILIGSAIAAALRGAPLPVIACCAASNVVEAVLGAVVIARVGADADLSRMRAVVGWALAALAGGLTGASIGVTALCFFSLHSFAHCFAMWRTWAIANALGVLVLGCFLSAWLSGRSVPSVKRLFEGGLLVALVAVTCHFAFRSGDSPATAQAICFLAFPFQIWAAMRLGRRGASAASLLALGVGLWDIVHAGARPGGETMQARLAVLQIFALVLSATGLMLAAAMEERRRAEEESRLLLTAIRASGDGVLIGALSETGDMSGSRILFANDALGRMLGADASQLVGQSLAALPQQGRRGGPAAIGTDRLREGSSVTGELDVPTASGERRVEWKVSPVPDAEGAIRHFVSVQRDVTQRRTEGRALRWNEALLRTVTAAAPVALYVFDERNSAVLYFNQRFIDLWALEDIKDRLRKGEVRSDEVERRSQLQAQDPSEITRRLPTPYEDQVLLRDGRTLRRYATQIAGADGRYFGKLLVFEDVSLRKRAEADLVSSRERYRALVSNLPDTILRISAEGRLLDAFGCCELVGPIEGSIGKHLTEALPEELAAALLAAVAETLQSARPRSLDQRVRSDAGSRYYEARVVRSGDGEALAIFRDVTEHRELQAKLLLSDRMASVGTLAAGVAHEINNPLSFVIANQQLLTERLEQSVAAQPSPFLDECLELLRESADGADRVRRIVRDLRIFARHDDESIGPVDLRHVIDRAVALAWNEIRHKARLVKSYGEVPLLAANEARLGQVFVNLVINAAQAIREGDVENNLISITTRLEAGRAVVEVRDTGCGIPKHDLARIFDPFFTTKPVGVGTGLGLAICHEIVVAQGGEIEVETAEGKGTCFRLRLLLSKEDGATTAPAPVPAAPEALLRRSILVVDDEAMVARSVARVLQGEHQVEAAGSAREALRLVGEGRRYDVILCDLMMPEQSGMELYQELGQLDPVLATRMVFLTGGAFTATARAFLEKVANPRLEKPFNLDELKRVVRQVAAT